MILNDEEHSYDYVIDLLIKLFRHPLPKAEALTVEIDTTGRAIVYTTHKELAELKRDQVIAYGPDPHMEISKGPLRCYVEPAPAGRAPRASEQERFSLVWHLQSQRTRAGCLSPFSANSHPA